MPESNNYPVAGWQHEKATIPGPRNFTRSFYSPPLFLEPAIRIPNLPFMPEFYWERNDLAILNKECVWLTTEGCGRAGIEGASAWKLLPFTRRTSQKPRVERTQNVPLKLSTYSCVSVCSCMFEHAWKETSYYVFILRFHLQLRYYAFSHFLFQVSHWSHN